MMVTQAPARDFETLIEPWLDAGYNLARWLLRDDTAADDVLQEAAIKAFRFLGDLRADDARAWFLGIVRNACYTHLQRQRDHPERNGFDDEALADLHWQAGLQAPDPAALLSQQHELNRVDQALQALPPDLREVIVLRELEGLPYTEIAQVAAIPVGTVMSRLSRARARLKALLQAHQEAR